MSDPAQSPNPMSLPYVEALYADFLRDPNAVPPEWRRHFEAMREANGFAANPRLSPSFRRRALYATRTAGRNGSSVNPIIDIEAADAAAESRTSKAKSGVAHRSGTAGSAAPGGATHANGSGRVAGVTTQGDIAAPGAFSLIQTFRARGH